MRISKNFVPTENGACTVSVVGEKANGRFYVDDMQLEQSEAPSNYNLLENSNFEYGTEYGWTLSENASCPRGRSCVSLNTKCLLRRIINS